MSRSSRRSCPGARSRSTPCSTSRGDPSTTCPRYRVRTWPASPSKGSHSTTTRELEGWIENLLELCGSLGAAGPLCLQGFLTERGPVLTEINARFGGGFPLAWLPAGCTQPGSSTWWRGFRCPPASGSTRPGCTCRGPTSSTSPALSDGDSRDRLRHRRHPLPGTRLRTERVRSCGTHARHHQGRKSRHRGLVVDGVRGGRPWRHLRSPPRGPRQLTVRATAADLVASYRGHRPVIGLLPGTSGLLGRLRRGGLYLGVLSDGPVVSQRAKVDVLRLGRWFDPILLTASRDGFSKPATSGFESIATTWSLPAAELAYVADNPTQGLRRTSTAWLADCSSPDTSTGHVCLRTDDGRPEARYGGRSAERGDQPR